MRGEIKIKSASGSLPIPIEPVDMVGAHERAASFTTRSIKKTSKIQALYTVIRMTDLTTLEGADTPGRVRQLCIKARYPVPHDIFSELQSHPDYQPIPSVAAVCVYPSLVKVAVDTLRGTGINIASVATAFPSGQLAIKEKLKDVKLAVLDGATEIDMVINRNAFLKGDYQTVFDEIVRVKEACGDAHLKVILETGELKTYDNVRLASHIAMEAGGDFIKTSTGKIQPAATLPVTLVMLQAIRDFHDKTGKMIGMKPAGGIKTAKQAIQYLVMVNETLGSAWLTPDMFRFGASSLLNDVIRQLFKQMTGRYYYDKVFSND